MTMSVVKEISRNCCRFIRRNYVSLLVAFSVIEFALGILGISFSLDTEAFCGISYDLHCDRTDFARATLGYVESRDTTIYRDFHWRSNNRYWFVHLRKNTIGAPEYAQEPLYIALPYEKSDTLIYKMSFTTGNSLSLKSLNTDTPVFNLVIRSINGHDVRDIPLLERYLYKRHFDRQFLSKLQLCDEVTDTPSLLQGLFINMPISALENLYKKMAQKMCDEDITEVVN